MNNTEPVSGWLFKWTNLIKGYKKRWFLIQDNLLSYYREPDAVGRHCRGTFDLSNAHICAPEAQTSFILIESSGRKHHLKALTEEDKEKWVSALTDLISRSQSVQTELESDYSAFNVPRSESGNNRSRNSFRFNLKGRSKLDFKTTSSPALPQPNNTHSALQNNCECPNQSCSNDHLGNSSCFGEKLRRVKVKRNASRTSCIQAQQQSLSLPVSGQDHISSDHNVKYDTVRRLSRQNILTVEESSRLEIMESLKKRLQDHINNIYSQVNNVETMLTSVSSDLCVLLHQSSSFPLNSDERFSTSDLERRTTSLKLALLEHRNDAKEFYETCIEALQYLTGAYARFNRQLVLEQERCITLERTVEQLAKELRNLEIQLSAHLPAMVQGKNINGVNSTAAATPQSLHSSERILDEEGDEFFDATSMLDAKQNDSPVSLVENSRDHRDRDHHHHYNHHPSRHSRQLHSPGTFTNTSHSLSIPNSSEVFQASSASLNSLVNVVDESSISGSDFDLPNGFMNRPIRVNSDLDSGGGNDSLQSDDCLNLRNKSMSIHQRNQTLKRVNPNEGVVRKRRTSIPVSPKIALNLWGIIKNAIGKDLTKIPIPVNFNEPLSFLQRAVEDLTYSYLLDRASQTSDPVEQIAYVAAFSVSCYSSTAYRTGKPFNSLLGETYECDRTDDLGWRCILEQVSHHPPGCSQHCESLRYKWKIWQDYFLSTKFRGKYLSITPKGTTNLQFADGSHYTWTKVTTVVHNLIVGTIWIDNCGDLIIQNHKNGYTCSLQFIAHSFFNRGQPRRVTGFVKNPSDIPVAIVQGTWDDHIEYQPLSVDKVPIGEPTLLWKCNPLPPNASDMYHFSQFAIELNEMEEGVAPTDSRFRPDQRLMEEGLWDQANDEKRRLEVKQRNKRHAWEKAVREGLTNEPLFTPIWFAPKHDSNGNVYHVYLNNYWQAKEKQDWSKCPDIY
ncbi:unnamed protein product [Trichobilharzia szidati]|nr:unnamed protein product [Trichobilharzia szidati]